MTRIKGHEGPADRVGGDLSMPRPMHALIAWLLRLCCLLTVATLPLRAGAAEAPPAPTTAPDFAALAARQFDVVVSIAVAAPAPDALTDEELDGLGFSAQEL